MTQTQSIKSSNGVTTLPPKAPQGTPAMESSGIEQLIGRLRDQGIAEGHRQADALVAAAQLQAADIVAAAQRQAEAVLVKAKEESGKLKAAGEDAIRLAMRDTILSLEGDLIKEFQSRLVRLVKEVADDPAFLQRLMLEVASQAAPTPTNGRMELLLPAELVSLEDLRRKPEEAKPGTLMHFVLSMGGGMLRDGVSFGVANDGEAGIRARLVDDDVQIDFTEAAFSEQLLRHMLPRFRALLRGAVIVDHGDTKPPEAVTSPKQTSLGSQGAPRQTGGGAAHG
jgi:V/A-type H+/Na+-transporting ATPase subunit E